MRVSHFLQLALPRATNILNKYPPQIPLKHITKNMDIEIEQNGNYDKPKKLKNFISIKSLLILIYSIFFSNGQISGALLVRIYFLHSGK